MTRRITCRFSRVAAPAALVAVSAVTMTGCSATGWLTETSTQKAADQHAVVAGTVMLRDNWERSANDAAYLVVGTGTDDTIDALDVEGTTYHGRVVLRITVEDASESGAGPSTRCYAYTFRHQMGDETPDKVPCTDHVVTLTEPLAEPDFDPAAVATLTGVLRRLVAAHTTDTATIDRHVAAAFGPPVIVAVGPAGLDHGTNHGTVFVRLDVPSHWQCMWAYITTTGQITAGSGNHRDCAD